MRNVLMKGVIPMLIMIKGWIKHLLRQVKAIEAALVALCLWWAFILFMPLNTFSTSSAYLAMSQVAGESVWALFFFLIAFFHGYGIATDNRKIRLPAVMCQLIAWLFVSAMFAIGNLATTATGTYFIISCLSAYVYFKVGEK
jgi:hypothetical protein